MRIFYAFLVLVTAAILYMLPVTEAIYDFRTDQRSDYFNYSTSVGETTANVTLLRPVYDDDTSTISVLSDTAADIPVFSSYNTTTRATIITGLADNTTRLLTVTYDVDALSDANAVEAIISRLDFLWLLMIIAFPIAALAAIFTGRAS